MDARRRNFDAQGPAATQLFLIMAISKNVSRRKRARGTYQTTHDLALFFRRDGTGEKQGQNAIAIGRTASDLEEHVIAGLQLGHFRAIV